MMNLKAAVNRHPNRAETSINHHVEDALADAGKINNQLGLARQPRLDRPDALNLRRIRGLQRQPLEVVDAVERAHRFSGSKFETTILSTISAVNRESSGLPNWHSNSRLKRSGSSRRRCSSHSLLTRGQSAV